MKGGLQAGGRFTGVSARLMGKVSLIASCSRQEETWVCRSTRFGVDALEAAALRY